VKFNNQQTINLVQKQHWKNNFPIIPIKSLKLSNYYKKFNLKLLIGNLKSIQLNKSLPQYKMSQKSKRKKVFYGDLYLIYFFN